MPGPTPKSADRRQRRNRGHELQLLPRGMIEPPPPPPRMLKATRDSWAEFWTSPLAASVDLASDLPGICRLFEKRDEYRRAFKEYRKCRMVEGSKKQPVLNPMGKVMNDLEKDIRQLEDRYGLSPKARAQLGITIGTAKRTLDDLNAGLELDEEEGGDPRIVAADEA